VKILRAEVANTVAADRFLEEIRIVTELSHPRLLPILDSGEWDGLLYYVTPFVERGSLRTRLERERQLPIADALAIVRDVADALADSGRIWGASVAPRARLWGAGRLVIVGSAAAALVAGAALALSARSRRAAEATLAQADSTRWLVASMSVTGVRTSPAE